MVGGVASDEQRSNIPKQLRWLVSYGIGSYYCFPKKMRLVFFADDFFWVIVRMIRRT